MNRRCGIYQIKCLETGEIYIGSSRHIYNRWYQHRLSLRKGAHHSHKLQAAWDEYGESRFSFSVIEDCAPEDLDDREQSHIDRMGPRLNILFDVVNGLRDLVRERAAAITHCPQGHLYDEDNTYWSAKGSRICRACNAARVAKILAAETPEQREDRRLRVRRYYEDTWDKWQKYSRERNALLKDEKSAYDKARRDIVAAQRRARMAVETPEKRAARLVAKLADYQKHKDKRLAHMKSRRAIDNSHRKARIAAETSEQRASRLAAKKADYERHRAERNAYDRARWATRGSEAKARRAAETPEQRDARLSKRRAYRRKNRIA